MAQDLFHYDKMVENALRGVVREALSRISRDGLRGAHHCYIGFSTTASGVTIPDYLREKFPADMTIVLQHQFWDLAIGDESFSVTLSFQKQPERLTVPWAAIRSFADPSVNFALEFVAPPEAAPASAQIAKLPAAVEPQPASAPQKDAEVVTLDSFRKR